MILRYLISYAFINKSLYKRLFSYLVNFNFEFTLFALFQKRSQIASIAINESDLKDKQDFDFDRNKIKGLDLDIKKLNLDLKRRKREIALFIDELINKYKEIN